MSTCGCLAQTDQQLTRANPASALLSLQANENSPVFRRDGLVLAPNSTADGSGCIAFWDRMPTGKLLSQAEAQQTIGDCCRTCRETALCNAFVWCPRKVGGRQDCALSCDASFKDNATLLLELGEALFSLAAAGRRL